MRRDLVDRALDAIAGVIEATWVTVALANTFPGATDLAAVAIVASATMFGIASRGDTTTWIAKRAILLAAWLILVSYMILDPLVRLIMNAIAWVAGRLAGHAYGLGKRFA